MQEPERTKCPKCGRNNIESSHPESYDWEHEKCRDCGFEWDVWVS